MSVFNLYLRACLMKMLFKSFLAVQCNSVPGVRSFAATSGFLA
jgi:hypothetical protein